MTASFSNKRSFEPFMCLDQGKTLLQIITGKDSDSLFMTNVALCFNGKWWRGGGGWGRGEQV